MEELLNILKKSDLKKVEKDTKIPYDRMRKWIKGLGKPKKDDFDTLTAYFKESGTTSSSTLPMYPNPSTASYVEVYNDLAEEAPAFYVSIPQFKDCEFGKIIFGHSMYPNFESGSYVFCKTVNDKDSIVYGEVYLIESEDFSVIKRLQKGKDDDYLLACSDNNETRPDGRRKFEDMDIKKEKIRRLCLVKGCFKQTQN